MRRKFFILRQIVKLAAVVNVTTGLAGVLASWHYRAAWAAQGKSWIGQSWTAILFILVTLAVTKVLAVRYQLQSARYAATEGKWIRNYERNYYSGRVPVYLALMIYPAVRYSQAAETEFLYYSLAFVMLFVALGVEKFLFRWCRTREYGMNLTWTAFFSQLMQDYLTDREKARNPRARDGVSRFGAPPSEDDDSDRPKPKKKPIPKGDPKKRPKLDYDGEEEKLDRGNYDED